MSDETPVTLWRTHPAYHDWTKKKRHDEARWPCQVEYRALPAAAYDRLVSERDALRASLARAEEALAFYREAANYDQSHDSGCGMHPTGEEEHGNTCGWPEVLRDNGDKSRAYFAGRSGT